MARHRESGFQIGASETDQHGSEKALSRQKQQWTEPSKDLRTFLPDVPRGDAKRCAAAETESRRPCRRGSIGERKSEARSDKEHEPLGRRESGLNGRASPLKAPDVGGSNKRGCDRPARQTVATPAVFVARQP